MGASTEAIALGARSNHTPFALILKHKVAELSSRSAVPPDAWHGRSTYLT